MTPILTHIALRVKNIERSAAFYEKYADFKIVAQREESGNRVAWLGNPEVIDRFVIVLLEMPYENCEQPSYDHLGLHVPSRDVVDQKAALAKKEGILTLGPERLGPVAGYLCLIQDPDGNQIEFSCEQDVETPLRKANGEK